MDFDLDTAAIGQLPHFGREEPAKLNTEQTIAHYRRHFVDLLSCYPLVGGAPRTVADIGTGFGWLAISLALYTDHKVIALDADARRLATARKLAAILRVEHRIDWVLGTAAQLPFGDQQIDVAFCVEVIEHLPDCAPALNELARVTRQIAVITTPNKLFPIIAHDTGLPFCHWLPVSLRDTYAAAFGRKERQEGNLFLTPARLNIAFRDFHRLSRFLQFPSYAVYLKASQSLLPSHRRERLSHHLKSAYFQCAAGAGSRSVYFLPNLASVFARTNG